MSHDFHMEAMEALLAWDAQGRFCGEKTLTAIIAEAMAKAVSVEREACAAIADEDGGEHDSDPCDVALSEGPEENACQGCRISAAIRARGAS